jgi:hypothetical protein
MLTIKDLDEVGRRFNSLKAKHAELGQEIDSFKTKHADFGKEVESMGKLIERLRSKLAAFEKEIKFEATAVPREATTDKRPQPATTIMRSSMNSVASTAVTTRSLPKTFSSPSKSEASSSRSSSSGSGSRFLDSATIAQIKRESITPSTFAANLLKRLFSKHELLGRSVCGCGNKNRKPIDIERLFFIKAKVDEEFLNGRPLKEKKKQWSIAMNKMNRTIREILKPKPIQPVEPVQPTHLRNYRWY